MKQGEVRIIGGAWRSRKLKFPAISGLRPTPDRVRETVFNWLTPIIQGANCLDLFSGSGALGLEALSRGAHYALLVDQAPAIINYLRQQITLLKTSQADACLANIPLDKLPKQFCTKHFDIIFLDPPFNRSLIKPTCDWLLKQNLLADNAYIYIEAESELEPLPIPTNWEIIKTKKSGQVGYHLLQNNSK
jgi:16S rRNA (guanine966-N2)-methyltransferase